jgi:hypothetical protein
LKRKLLNLKIIVHLSLFIAVTVILVNSKDAIHDMGMIFSIFLIGIGYAVVMFNPGESRHIYVEKTQEPRRED